MFPNGQVTALAARAAAEDRLEALLARMTLEEKVSLMTGQDFWSLAAIERLGIPALKVSDGPTGLRSVNSERATVFPVGVALAASWDPDLVNEVGAAIAREAIAYGVDVLLAPAVNIHRTPIGGRNFETYSEDPCLAARIAAAFVTGVQAEGVGTSIKHYAANNQEHERLRGNSRMSVRTLREIYLAAFETVIREANPWTVMSAYNRVNGVFASENAFLLNELLKGEWGYDGVVMSDWGATKSTVDSANNGLDLEMPGPAKHFGVRLIEAARSHQVSEAVINDHVLRLLRLIERCGLLDGNPKQARGEKCSDRHRETARRAARQSAVLLKNDGGLLPIRADVKRIAVIGQPARMPAVQGGGSSQVSPDRIVSLLDGLKQSMGEDVEIIFERGMDHEPHAPLIDWRLLSPDREFSQQGLLARYYVNPGFEGAVGHEEIDWHFSKLGFGGAVQTDDDLSFSVEWTGYFRPEQDGEYKFSIVHSEPDVELSVGDTELIGEDTQSTQEFLFMILPLHRSDARLSLEAGKVYPIRIRYSQHAEMAVRAFNVFSVSMRVPDPDRSAAIKAAAAADLVLLFVGSGTTEETEGRDRANLTLSAGQDDFVREVLSVNPSTAVIVNSGSPVEMPWVSEVPAILHIWLPGGEGGGGLADLLTGIESPSGKLPMTFPLRYQDSPAFPFYPGGRTAEYGEGIFVGYRYYDKVGRDVLFPFGHGLTFSTFDLGELRGPIDPVFPDDVEVSLTLTNIGCVVAAETVQIYIEDKAGPEAMPLRQLRVFQKVRLAPGEASSLVFKLSQRDFAWYDEYEDRWTVTPGRYVIHAGFSSRDIRQSLEIEVRS